MYISDRGKCQFETVDIVLSKRMTKMITCYSVNTYALHFLPTCKMQSPTDNVKHNIWSHNNSNNIVTNNNFTAMYSLTGTSICEIIGHMAIDNVVTNHA